MSEPLSHEPVQVRLPTFLGLRRSEWAIGGTSVALNVLVNGVLPERYHVPASLAAAAVVSGFAAKAGADMDAQGLKLRDIPRGAMYGVAAGTPIAVALSAGRLFGGSRQLYGERRIVDATPTRAAYELFVRIPLGTALPEEMIFRGALQGLFSRRHSRLRATAMTSALFGLWHIAPTLDRLETNAAMRGRTRVQKAGWVALTVGVTTATGFALSFLRFRSRSVVAPWFAHSAANGAGYLAGWLAARLDGNAGGEDDASQLAPSTTQP